MHIIISCGDIEGIGLECLFAAITRNEHTCSLTVEHTLSIAVNDESLNQCIDLLPSVRCKVTNNSIQFHNGTVLNIIPCQTHALPRWNGPTGDSTRLAIESLEVAADYLKSGRADAVLTLPIAKDTMQDAGWHFPGQTEFFASVAGVSRPMMILFSGSVRVALATIHIPISKVSESLSVNGISDSVTLLAKTLTRDFGIASPRIAVLGVNPHAGEQGTIGTEERDILIPAVDSVRKEGID
ncbi:MAG: 4-hydroxythreonine-4-phosphate dehydrogenase PdxA, partial [Candidatus Kapabacteria bacterium]|nr:4-hydroxythreonine-4-phosphate dehydrogenase PdxA [Candidatus Kapabacteria bacterium]